MRAVKKLKNGWQMFPWKAVLKGLFLAPLPVWAVLGVWGFWNDLAMPNRTWRDAAVHQLFLFPYMVIGSYLIGLLIALPLYALGWRYLRVSFFRCLFCGAMIGGAPVWIFFALQVFGLWPKWQDESLGGVPLIVAGNFTRAGLVHYFMSGVYTAAHGMAIAFLFWWIAVRNNPLAQGKARTAG